ncbi:MAG: hypothetical protein L6N94_04510 [Candidatus Methylarchaceae archaeon HK01M]|nr:hypothetical protein [Candidatus Methylarchaceae archaeon HK01M]
MSFSVGLLPTQLPTNLARVNVFTAFSLSFLLKRYEKFLLPMKKHEG